MKRASYHNHTVFSDGAETPEEFLRQALTQGVEILGFADHYYRNPEDSAPFPEWALKPHLETRYFEVLSELKAKAPIEIRTGLEFDWLDGSAPWLAPMAQDPRLDYAIGSVHYVGTTCFDCSRTLWESLSQEEIDDLVRRYWVAVREMAESGLFDIVGHIDLIKKFGFYAASDVTPWVREALDAVKAADMVVELNTSGWRKDCQECYPSEAILRACYCREIPVTVSADAHRARFACSNFSRAYDLLARVGYTELTRFRARERFFEPLEP